MIVTAGLVILIAAVIAAEAGVLGNTGSSHAPGHALGNGSDRGEHRPRAERGSREGSGRTRLAPARSRPPAGSRA